MTTCTYNSTGLPVKDRLIISNLLDLFRSRLNAKWAPANPLSDQPSHAVLIDLDHPDGPKAWDAASPAGPRIAVTANDALASTFISRPIRAFGPNGVVVLFNSLSQSSSEAVSDPQREPSRMRMTGRLEVSPAPVRPIRPQPTVAPRPTPPRVAAPAHVEPQNVSAEPPRPRVAIQWGPPVPVVLSALTRMPGARIHRFGGASEPAQVDIAPPVISEPVSSVPPAKSWKAAEVPVSAPLESMPVAHRPVEIHQPAAPIIGRSRVEAPPPLESKDGAAVDTPVLRAAPRQWRTPEPETARDLIDFRTPEEPAIISEKTMPEKETEVTSPELAIPEAAGVEAFVAAIAKANAETPSESPAESLPAESLSDALPFPTPDAPGISEPFEATIEPELEAPPVDARQAIESLSQAIQEETYPEEASIEDADADWWGTADAEITEAGGSLAASEEGALLSALKAIKASGQPGILEIAGLPAVCVIPARNIYFTTAPAARIELAATSHAEITWRTCPSEAEARRLSGTGDSRQASLEQLSWTASLLTPPADPQNMADQAVRLRRWPPITESRGRSKFLRYATLLSGAQATPRELAEITGDPIGEIIGFVNACSRMNLLESFGSSKRPAAQGAVRSAGAGILRDMIEQLTPPKI